MVHHVFLPPYLPIGTSINFSSKPKQSSTTHFLLSHQTSTTHSFTLYFYFFFLFVSFFLLQHRNFHQSLSPSICPSQFSSLHFLLQIKFHSFVFINFFFSPFFPKISLSRYEKFLEFTFRPGRNETAFKILVHTMSEKRKKNTARTPESSESYRYRCLTCANTGTFPKMMCRCNLDDNPQTKSSLTDIYKKSISDK